MATNENHGLTQEDISNLEVAIRGALELNAREARKGDVTNFIAFQWPGLILDDFQWDVINHVFDPAHREVFIKGCTKPGKGFSVAVAVNIWFDVFPKSKIILTGPSAEHVTNNLFAEVVAVRKRMKYPAVAEILTTSIRSGMNNEDPTHYIRIANPKSGEGFSGQHSTHTLFVFDEASSAENWLYDNARKQSRMIIALSNPRTLSGWFRRGYGDIDINKTQSIKTASGKRRLITVGGEDCRNVREKRLESPFAPVGGMDIKGTRFEHGDFIPPEFYVHVKPVIASQLDYARYLEIMSDPEEFKRDIFGRGWFPKEDAMLQVVLGSWLKRHIDYWKDLHDGMDIPVTSFGLDVAASEFGDESILISGGPLGVRMIHDRKHADVMQTTGWVLDTATEQYGINLKEGQVPVAIDYGGGYGRGVGDRLKEMGVAVIACHPSKRSSLPSRYEDLRSELYGEFGERLNPHGPWASQPFALPPDQMLHDDLCAAEKIIASDGVKFRLIPKEKPHKLYTGPTVESKIGRSPDRGDAICLLYHAVRRQASIPDYSERSLVIDLSTPEKPPENETPQEKWDRWKREDMARLEAQVDSMADGDYEFGF